MCNIIYILDSNCMGYFLKENSINKRSEYNFVKTLVENNKKISITALTLYEAMKYGESSKDDLQCFYLLEKIFTSQNLYIGDDIGEKCKKNLDMLFSKKISLRKFWEYGNLELEKYKRKFLYTLLEVIEYLLIVLNNNSQEIENNSGEIILQLTIYNASNNIKEKIYGIENRKLSQALKEMINNYMVSIGILEDVQLFSHKMKIKQKKEYIIEETLNFLQIYSGNKFHNNTAILYGYCSLLFLIDNKKFAGNDFVDIYIMSLIGPNVRVLTHETKWLKFMDEFGYLSNDLKENYMLCNQINGIKKIKQK